MRNQKKKKQTHYSRRGQLYHELITPINKIIQNILVPKEKKKIKESKIE